MKLLLLCAGKGSRLRPYTDTTAKPFLPLGSSTIVETLVERIAVHHEIDGIFINLHHLASSAEPVVGRLKRSYEVTTREEEQLLGPAGSIATFGRELSQEESFIVASGDIFLSEPLAPMTVNGKESAAVLTHTVPDIARFDEIKADARGRVVGFHEKRPELSGVPGNANAGIYCLPGGAVGLVPSREASDYCSDLLPALQAAGTPVFEVKQYGEWDDLGTVESYERHLHLRKGQHN